MEIAEKINEKIAEVARHYIDIERLAIVGYLEELADEESNSNVSKGLRHAARGIESKEHFQIEVEGFKDIKDEIE